MGPEILSWAQLPTPEPGPGEVRSAIKAVSLNFPNLLIVQNKYQLKLPLSFMHEAEHAGVIDALGSEARNLRIGLPMAAFAGTGGFATHACVDAALVLLLPEGMALDAAAVFMLTCGTTHHALLDRAGARRGRRAGQLGDSDRQGGRCARQTPPLRAPTSASRVYLSVPMPLSTKATRACANNRRR